MIHPSFNWDLFLDRALWLGIGLAIGMVLGYMKRAAREVHETKQKVEQFLESQPPARLSQPTPSRNEHRGND